MFSSIAEFTGAWKQHSEATLKLFNALTDQSLTQKVGPDDRDLGRIAWHLVTTIPEMTGRLGLKADGPGESDPLPKSAGEVVKGYTALAQSLAEQIEKNWDDATLQTEDDMYGMKWRRGLTLRILIDHEIHHLGQMTVLMRQAGLKVPGLYGPAREEWEGFGMKPPEI